MLSSFPSLSEWLDSSDAAKDAVLSRVANELSLGHPLTVSRDAYLAPRVVVDYGARGGTTIAFRLIPPHTVPVGLSEQNLTAVHRISEDPQITIEEMTPLVHSSLNVFLVAEIPLSVAQARVLIGLPIDGRDDYPAYLDERAALAAVSALGAELPSEAHWECIAKAGGDPLFPFGDTLPEETVIEPWIRYDLGDTGAARTRFGTGGLLFAEWCLDAFAMSHEAGAERLADTRTIKGGAAYFWPWQDAEWVWCLCSMRMPSSDLDGGVAVVRPVIAL